MCFIHLSHAPLKRRRFVNVKFIYVNSSVILWRSFNRIFSLPSISWDSRCAREIVLDSLANHPPEITRTAKQHIQIGVWCESKGMFWQLFSRLVIRFQARPLWQRNIALNLLISFQLGLQENWNVWHFAESFKASKSLVILRIDAGDGPQMRWMLARTNLLVVSAPVHCHSGIINQKISRPRDS